MSVAESTHEYSAGDIAARGIVYRRDTSAPQPGIVVFHEGPGLDAHAQLRGRMLAELGYCVLAADMYGGGQIADTHERVMEVVTPLREDRSLVRARVNGALDALIALPGVDRSRTAAVGYCIGGLAALELARSGADVGTVVCFHGLLDTPDPADARNIKGRVLVITGADDPIIPDQQVTDFEAEMTAAEVDWTTIKLGGVRHAFTNMIEAEHLAALGFGSYSKNIDERSWGFMTHFLAETMTPAS
ncbi:dienelactone hydrolase family protein [Novosphingobium mathurense]|nr:dienelactone hydrolase family protein [Novosphingobium mathurense]